MRREDEEKIIRSLRSYKRPKTKEELEEVLKKISEDITGKHAEEKRGTYVLISRNPTFARLVKERDGYVCQVCGTPGFEKENGEKYAEAHHIRELSKTRIDNPNEMICVCPMCHRIIHHGTDIELKKRKMSKMPK